MSNTESHELAHRAQALVRIKDAGAKALRGTLGYHQSKEQAIISEAVLRAMCEAEGVDFDELIKKYE
jgi:AMMECR1 domain-containing protein